MGEGEAEAEEAVAASGRAVDTERRAAALGVVEPAATAKHAASPTGCPSRVVLRIRTV